MKIILSLLLMFSVSFAGTCYTAVAGFVAIGTLSAKLSSKVASSTNKITDLGSVAKERENKLKLIKKLQTQIREVQHLNYVKSQSILHNLKVKNSLLDIEGSMLTNAYFQK